MSSEVLEIVPEIATGLRSLFGLPKTFEDIQKKLDLTAREIQDVKKIIQNVRLEPYQTIQIFMKRVSGVIGVDIKFDTDKPQFTFDNPFDKDMRLLSLIMIPDTNFKTLGALSIKVSETDLMPITTFGDFTDISALEIPLPNNTGKLFKKQSKIKFHVWTNGATVNLTFIWVIGQYYN